MSQDWIKKFLACCGSKKPADTHNTKETMRPPPIETRHDKMHELKPHTQESCSQTQ